MRLFTPAAPLGDVRVVFTHCLCLVDLQLCVQPLKFRLKTAMARLEHWQRLQTGNLQVRKRVNGYNVQVRRVKQRTH